MKWKNGYQVVINHKTTKFESNSQRSKSSIFLAVSCYQSQNYKIWKQFTTRGFPLYIHIVLLSISKLQNLKVIHNYVTRGMAYFLVVINHKTTEFESNSQRAVVIISLIMRCYQSQNYKIWKQFTTTMLVKFQSHLLLSITKLQNLKAIHNFTWYY